MRRLDPDDTLPRGAALIAAGSVFAFAAATLVHGWLDHCPGCSLGEGVSSVAAGLVVISTLPWALLLAGLRLPPVLFVVLVAAPLGVLHVGGRALGIVSLGADDFSQASLFIVIMMVGQIVAVGSRVLARVAVVVGLAIVVGRAVVAPDFAPWIFWSAGVGVAASTGLLIRRQAELVSDLREAQQALAAEAAGRERQRIAREVHDILAHTLTLTMLQINAARLAVERDPDAARVALEDAERLGRQSLGDVRRSVGLLRREADPPLDRPQPDARDLRDVVDAYRSAGAVVDLQVEGRLAELGAVEGLTLYQVAREALANAVRHAPGEVIAVTVVLRDATARLRVTNRHRGSADHGGGGTGLVGIRERAALVGGTVTAGASGAEWVVDLSIPLAPASDRDGARFEVETGPAE